MEPTPAFLKENPMERGAWWRCKELDLTEQLSMHSSEWYSGCLLTVLGSLYPLVCPSSITNTVQTGAGH